MGHYQSRMARINRYRQIAKDFKGLEIALNKFQAEINHFEKYKYQIKIRPIDRMSLEMDFKKIRETGEAREVELASLTSGFPSGQERRTNKKTREISDAFRSSAKRIREKLKALLQQLDSMDKTLKIAKPTAEGQIFEELGRGASHIGKLQKMDAEFNRVTQSTIGQSEVTVISSQTNPQTNNHLSPHLLSSGRNVNTYRSFGSITFNLFEKVEAGGVSRIV